MTHLVRWDPFAEFRTHGLRRAFGFPTVEMWHNADATLTFPVDVSDADDHIVVKAALPGIKPDEVDVSVNDGVLTIKGETERDDTSEGVNFYRRELHYGNYSRSITLPAVVDHDKADAEFKDGLLTITLPKAEEARPKQITVKVGVSNGAAAPKAKAAIADPS